jgi:hypothetical protein
MPEKEGNEQRQVYQDEEWQAGNSGYLPDLRHQDVPDWQRLESSDIKRKDALNIVSFLFQNVILSSQIWRELFVCPHFLLNRVFSCLN